MALKAFESQPQGFNGPLGFAFFEWLDDASRNAALCASNLLMESYKSTVDGHLDKAHSLILFSNSCLDVSTLLYTISENAGALYYRYVEGGAQLMAQGAENLQKCTEILKKNSIAPKK